MATNRLFLVCYLCGAEFSIARLSAGEDVWEPSREPPDRYAAWLETHTVCGAGVLHVTLASENDDQLRIGHTKG